MGRHWSSVDLRILKFRAWSYKQCEFYHKVLVGDTENDEPCSLVYSHDNVWIKFDNDSGVIQQYTGYKDKHGIDIYEGDLIQYKAAIVDKDTCFILPNQEIISDVIWRHGRYWLNDGNYSNTLDNIKNKEVVGNIFEPLKNLE